jgi:hypothetical protein
MSALTHPPCCRSQPRLDRAPPCHRGGGGGSLPCKPGKSRSSVIGVRLCNWGLVKFNIDVVEITD